MFLKINKEKVKFVQILNGEPVLLKVENIQSDGDVMTVNTGMFPESEYIADNETKDRGHIVGISNAFKFDMSYTGYTGYTRHSTIAIKLIKEEVKNKLSLTDSDVAIEAQCEWKYPEKPIRLSIPFNVVVENSTYNALVSTLIDTVPYYKNFDSYILYLEEIYPQHRTILEDDPNVIIEE